MSFDEQIPGSHHSNQDREHWLHARKFSSVCIWSIPSLPLTPAKGISSLLISASIDQFCLFGPSCVWNCIVCTLLCMVSLLQTVFLKFTHFVVCANKQQSIVDLCCRSRIPLCEYSTLLLSLFSDILIMLIFVLVPWLPLKSQGSCCSFRYHMQTTAFRGQEKLFSPSASEKSLRSLPTKIFSCGIGQNLITYTSLNQILAEGMELPQVSKTNQDLPLGLGRGSASPDDQGSLVPEQNQDSVSKKGGQ